MNIINYIQDYYGVLPEYLWQDTPNVCVFRHQHNRKWFAVVMNDIPAAKLGLKENKPLKLFIFESLSTSLQRDYISQNK